MPPKGMFRDRQRPGAMEYGICLACNNGTRGSDAVAVLMALIHPDNTKGSWQAEKSRKLMPIIDRYAPGVREEMSLPGKFNYSGAAGAVWPSPESCSCQAGRPQVKAHLGVFGAKLAMALYREHVRVALPLDGAAWCSSLSTVGSHKRT